MTSVQTAWAVATLVASAIGVGACGFSGLTTSETDVAVTVQDEDRDYSKYRTYSLTREIIDLCEVVGEDDAFPLGGSAGVELDNCFEVDHVHDEAALDAIDTNMKARGFKKVAAGESPDVTLLVAVVARDNWYYAPGYWWCDPYYHSCWYPPSGYLYNFPTGTLLLNMVDNSESTEEKLSSAWFAAMSGLYARARDKTGTQRIQDVIARAFNQSPYLEVGK
jgi:hypothetical protein